MASTNSLILKHVWSQLERLYCKYKMHHIGLVPWPGQPWACTRSLTHILCLDINYKKATCGLRFPSDTLTLKLVYSNGLIIISAVLSACTSTTWTG